MKVYLLFLLMVSSFNISFAQKIDATHLADGKYIGESRKGKKHGKGSFIWTNGSKYEGTWKADLMDGYGIYTSVSDNTYRGDWHHGQMHGNGIYSWANGIKYKGYFRYGKREGIGKLTYPDGSFHEGLWENGMSNGFGKHLWASGSQYIGDWKNDKRHGRGVMIYSNGKVEQGNWENDRYISCKCDKEILPVNEAFEKSQAVFVGKVLSVNDTYGYDIVKIKVTSYWKGKISYLRNVTLTAGYGSCDQIYIQDKSYLVYASKNKTGFGYYADKCNRTNMVQNASRDIEILKKIIPCKMKFPVRSSISGEKDPVCGCDGKEYKNPSLARKDGIQYWNSGSCE